MVGLASFWMMGSIYSAATGCVQLTKQTCVSGYGKTNPYKVFTLRLRIEMNYQNTKTTTTPKI